jgi:hypothetical protein
MKVRINWTEAPEWANYLTRNPRGSYIWCEQQPTLISGRLVAGRTQIAQELWDLAGNAGKPLPEYSFHLAS